MKRVVVHIDRFSEGLDELTQRQQRDHQEVLRVLHRIGRFSVFEATANDHIAKTIDFLVSEKYIETEQQGYPWNGVRLTQRGKKAIGAGE